MERKLEKNGGLNLELRDSGISEMILSSEIVKLVSPQVNHMLHRYTNLAETSFSYDFFEKFAKMRAYAAIRESLADSAIYIRQIERECEKQGIEIDEMCKRILSKYSEIGIHPLEAELSSSRGSSSMRYFARMAIDNVVFSNLSNLKARLVHMLDDVKDGSIFVDIGCGPGEYITEILAKKIENLSVVGIDTNRTAIQISKRRTLKHKNVGYILADAHHLPIKTGSIGHSLSVWTIGFLESPKKCVKEMYRILRKGGKAVVTVPHIYKYIDNPLGYRNKAKHIDNLKYRNLSKAVNDVGLKTGFRVEDKVRWTYEEATTFTWIYKQTDEILIKFAK